MSRPELKRLIALVEGRIVAAHSKSVLDMNADERLELDRALRQILDGLVAEEGAEVDSLGDCIAMTLSGISGKSTPIIFAALYSWLEAAFAAIGGRE